MMVVAMTAFDDDHLLAVAVAAMPAVMAMDLGAGAVMMVMTAMHSAFARLDDDALCAGDRRDRNCQCCGSRNNETKLPHVSLL
jgi:hypothetical protein